MESTASNALLDKAAEYIEKLTDQVSQQQSEIERLELVAKEQGLLIDKMTAQLKDNETAGPVDNQISSDQQQRISDLETTIEVMTLDLESRSNSIVALFSQITHLKALIARLLDTCFTDMDSMQVIESLKQLSTKINQLEAYILETGIPLAECTESSRQETAVTESAIHIPPTVQSSEKTELDYYKCRCNALEHQVETLRAALLSQEELSRRVVSTIPSAQHSAPTLSRENTSMFSFRQLAFIEMLHLINKELHKSPKVHINNAFDPELAACLKAVAIGEPATAQRLQHFPETFIRLMSGM